MGHETNWGGTKLCREEALTLGYPNLKVQKNKKRKKNELGKKENPKADTFAGKKRAQWRQGYITSQILTF